MATPKNHYRIDHSTWRLVCAALLMLLVCLGQTASAMDNIVDRQMLEDTAGTLGIGDVVDMPFVPAAPILSEGYTDSAFWLKLTVSPAPAGTDMVLRTWPTYLDELTLYAPDGSGGWLATTTGDRTPYVDQRAGVSHNFSIEPKVETTYYLRLKTTSTSLLGVEASSEDELFTDDLRFGLLGALVVGLMIAMLIWAGLEYLATRDSLMIWYIVAQAISIGYGLSLTGYLAILLPGLVLDGFTSGLVWITTFTQLLFYLRLLRAFDLSKWSLVIIVPLVVAELVVPALFLIGLTRVGLLVNGYVVLCAPPSIMLLAFLARHEAPPGRALIRWTGVLQSSALVLTALPLLGLVDATVFSRHGILFHGVLSGALAFVILRARSIQLRREAMQAGLARRQLEVERREHDIRGRFLAMLSHELKTPLSVVRLSLPAIPADSPARARVGSAVDTMTTLIDLSTCAEQLEQRRLPVDQAMVDVGELVSRIVAEPAFAGRVAVRRNGPMLIASDVQLLDVVLRNLIDNAVKYSPGGSDIDVRLERAPGADGLAGVRIAVENAQGRVQPDAERMFDKFYRGPGAGAKSGLGLGLYVVRGIAELLGGNVSGRVAGERVCVEVWHPC